MDQETYKLNMAVIAGASEALKFLEENPKAFSRDVLQHVTNNAEQILKKIDSPAQED